MSPLTTQNEKAHAFHALHRPGKPLVLYNIWDAGSATALAETGAVAVATGSDSVAAAQGYPDGQAIPLDFVLRIAERIVHSVDLPVSIDFESGYGATPDELNDTVGRLIRTGAIGINFEDGILPQGGQYSIDEQVARIAACRAAADAAGVPLFINARTDLFLASPPEQHDQLIDDALARAAAYARAGADGFFVPLLRADLVRQIVDGVDLPVNVMARSSEELPSLAAQGVARISFGPAPYRQARADLISRYQTDIQDAF